MATAPQTRQEGDFFQGLWTSGAIPERFLKRGMDNLGVMSYISRDYTKFSNVLHTRFGKSKNVPTREHRVYELTELDRVLSVTVPSVAANNHTTFGISNAQAAMLQANDVLIVKGLYAYCVTTALVAGQVSTNNTVPTPNSPRPLGYTTGGQPVLVAYGRQFGEDPLRSGSYFVDYEQIIVRDVGAANSAGTGSTLITVERFFCGPGARDFGGERVPISLVNTAVNTNDAGLIDGNLELLRALPTWPEGTNAPKGFYKNPIIDNNFTQEFKYAIEKTNESSIEKTWHGKDPIEISRMLSGRMQALDYERSVLFGRKGKTIDASGRVQYTMGGVIESIPKDADHILTHSASSITYPSLLRTLDQVMKNGGSEEKWMFTGTDLYTDLKVAFYDSGYLRYDEKASAEFDIPIESIIGAGVELKIVPLQTMQEAGWGRRALVLDMGVPSFVPVTHEGWDMKIEKDIAEKGSQIYKEQWVSIKGLERRYAQYQSIINFV